MGKTDKTVTKTNSARKQRTNQIKNAIKKQNLAETKAGQNITNPNAVVTPNEAELDPRQDVNFNQTPELNAGQDQQLLDEQGLQFLQEAQKQEQIQLAGQGSPLGNQGAAGGDQGAGGGDQRGITAPGREVDPYPSGAPAWMKVLRAVFSVYPPLAVGIHAGIQGIESRRTQAIEQDDANMEYFFKLYEGNPAAAAGLAKNPIFRDTLMRKYKVGPEDLADLERITNMNPMTIEEGLNALDKDIEITKQGSEQPGDLTIPFGGQNQLTKTPSPVEVANNNTLVDPTTGQPIYSFANESRKQIMDDYRAENPESSKWDAFMAWSNVASGKGGLKYAVSNDGSVVLFDPETPIDKMKDGEGYIKINPTIEGEEDVEIIELKKNGRTTGVMIVDKQSGKEVEGAMKWKHQFIDVKSLIDAQLAKSGTQLPEDPNTWGAFFQQTWDALWRGYGKEAGTLNGTVIEALVEEEMRKLGITGSGGRAGVETDAQLPPGQSDEGDLFINSVLGE